MERILEICVDTVTDALAAAAAGADRIEFCSRLDVGGLTPTFSKLVRARSLIDIPIFPMVRPRPGNFQYTAEEFALMLDTVRQYQEAGVDGIVVGMTDGEGKIATEQLERVMELAKEMPVTFHRAFDALADPFAAIEGLKGMGIKRILTSAGARRAADAVEALGAYAESGAQKISIMPGGGVRSENLAVLVKVPGIIEFHSSARLGGMEMDVEEVRALRGILDE